jgi:hypothetical protein
LVLLDPQQPIRAAALLPLELEKNPRLGQSVGILTLTWSRNRARTSYGAAVGLVPATVTSLLRDGLFSMDIYSFSGISGSPVIDMSSGRVVGICMRRYQHIETSDTEVIPFLLPNGTWTSIRAPYLVAHYGIAGSLAWARQFFKDLP